MSATRALSVSDSSSGDSHGEDWQDVEPDEEETLSIVSFFDSQTFPDAKSMLSHCAEKHGFDFLATCQRLGLDFHGAVKLCNFGMSLPGPRPHSHHAFWPESCAVFFSLFEF